MSNQPRLKQVLNSGVTDDGQMAINFEIEADGRSVTAGFVADPKEASVLVMAVLSAAGEQRNRLVAKMQGTENAQTMAPAAAPRIESFMFGQGQRDDGTVETVIVFKLQGGFELVTGMDKAVAKQLVQMLSQALEADEAWSASN